MGPKSTASKQRFCRTTTFSHDHDLLCRSVTDDSCRIDVVVHVPDRRTNALSDDVGETVGVVPPVLALSQKFCA